MDAPPRLQTDDAARGELKELRDCFDVPIGIFRAGMAQIGRQLDHLARRVLDRCGTSR